MHRPGSALGEPQHHPLHVAVAFVEQQRQMVSFKAHAAEQLQLLLPYVSTPSTNESKVICWHPPFLMMGLWQEGHLRVWALMKSRLSCSLLNRVSQLSTCLQLAGA